MTILSYKDLQVWQLSMKIAVEIYRVTSFFPESEKYGLTSQLRRAAISVPSNIGEGHSRNQTGEYIRFLSYAIGSVAELQTQVELSERLSYFEKIGTSELSEDLLQLWKQLIALRRSLLSKLNIQSQIPTPNS
jgi:four helix bundle protein